MTSQAYIINEGISSTVKSGVEYEVFLSFRGLDTRDGFTDHLYTRLTDAGIRVYRDDEELRFGEEIGPELLEGISQSKIVIPILSKGYAASKWCLKELAFIMDCKRSSGLKVMPLFYYVTPSEVRNQTGDYGEAFKSHEKCYGEKTVEEWKEALRQVGYLKGWDVQSNFNRQEGKLVKEVTKVVLRELKKAYLLFTDCLVGAEHHVEKILKMMTAETSGVQIGGIYGMGGIGKTTLAKVVYNHLLPHFECYSFLADIRENSRSNGIVLLQKKLILDILSRESANISNKDEGIAIISERFSNKKVLILLDDVDEIFQLEALMAKHDRFGFGSRIIITTRNRGILDSIQVDWSYEVSGMDRHRALELFSMHAFRNNQPSKEYATLSNRIVGTTGGLPLALQVVGSFLCGKSKTEWNFTLKKLDRVPHDKVGGKLRISFEALDDQQKQIFLDIACFFIGANVRIVSHFWNDLELCTEETIEVLLQMSLIKIQEDNSLWMHDQLRDLGREIVRQEHIEPEKRSRMWNQEEAMKVVWGDMGNENVRGICLDLSQQPPCIFNEELPKLPYLRFLRVNSKCLSDDDHFIQKERFFGDKLCLRIVSSIFFHKSPRIFPKLRWLSWHYFPETYTISCFSLENLAILDLSWSKIKSSWSGWRCVKMATNLRVLNLTGCNQLVRTPDFSSHLLLEGLILEGCHELVEIDASISKLKHLAFVNLKDCRSLRELPKELSCTECLEELILDNTSSILEIPSWPHMKKLKLFRACYCHSLKKFSSLDFVASISELSLDYSSITSLPVSIGRLVKLLKLSLVYCKGIKELPRSIGNLASLVELDLSFSGVVEIPYTIGYLKNLKSLSVRWTPIRYLPVAIGMMESLLIINAEYCHHLHELPKLPQSLTLLRASQSNIERESQIFQI